ncbi:MAG: XdhC family protein [Candidatus Dormibacteria bacterium]
MTAQSPDGPGVFPSIAEALARGETVAVATIVGRRGSTPREIGAKMLVGPRGGIVGTVGGGAAEAEICRRAATVLAGGGAQLLTLDLTGTLQLPLQGICGGSFDVFIEPWGGSAGEAGPPKGETVEPLDLVRAAIGELEVGRSATLVTVIEAEGGWSAGVGARVLLGEGKKLTNGDLPGELMDQAALAAAERDLGAGAGARVQELTARDRSATARALVERLRPPEALLIMGGGHVAQPLAVIATTCGLAVTVVDDRQEFATAARFPTARAVVADGAAFLAEHRPGATTHVVFVNRGPAQDIAALGTLLEAAAGGYIGLIGSQRRVWSVLQELRAEGVPAEQLARVRGPVGLDLGGTTPAEIALEIMAELLKWRHQSTGQELSARLRRRLLRQEAPASR